MVLAGGGGDGVEAEGGEQIPRRHLAAVVVAAEAVGRGVVLITQDHADALLRFPRVIGPVIEIGDVVRGLVAVDVAADDAFAGDVFGFGSNRQIQFAFRFNF